MDGTLYLWRLRVLETPWFGVKLHWIRGADDDRALHDHPWWFVSFVLWGSYEEIVPKTGQPLFCGADRRRVRWFNRKKATDLHRIVQVSRGGAWTLVVNGPYQRKWGFQTRYGWTPWDVFLGLAKTDGSTE
jgi:hypothetical protein